MINNLSEVPQNFVDAVFRHNGRPEPRPPGPSPILHKTQVPADLKKLQQLVNVIDPDSGYDDWFSVGAAIYSETQGADAGFHIFDEWSAKGKKYESRQKLKYQWDHFKTVDNPKTMGSIVHIARQQGADVDAIIGKEKFEKIDTVVILTPDGGTLNPDFEPSETVVVDPQEIGTGIINPLRTFSLTGQSTELDKMACEEKLILGNLVLSGQITLIYAPPNSGKTLITLHLLIDAINRGAVPAQCIYYLNLDDSSKGLIVKLLLAEEYGFEMLAEGYNGFKAKTFPDIIIRMIEKDQARGIVLIVDTLKKVVDLMHKKQSSDIANIFRQFVLKGGTVICLAHTNKRRDGNNKLIYAGTSDFVDDSDCAYTLGVIESPSDPCIKVVEFENIKRRGNVAERAAYCYSTERDISYNELLLSVEPFDESKVAALKHAEDVRSDSEMISIVKSCIREGIDTKMNLAIEAAKRAGISRKSAINIIEKYTGTNPDIHSWNYTVAERGRQVFNILQN